MVLIWRVCLTCRNWSSDGVPPYAKHMGMAFCAVKNTRAVTMAHWRECGAWSPEPDDGVQQRVVWLRRVGVDVDKKLLKVTEHA